MATKATDTITKLRGEQVDLPFEYLVFDSVQDAIENSAEGETEVLSLINRMVKIDARNKAAAPSTSTGTRAASSMFKKLSPEKRAAFLAMLAEAAEAEEGDATEED